jgi:hypothetical protein
MTIKEWFDSYTIYGLEQIKQYKKDIEEGKMDLIEPNQMIGLDLAIVTIERNPDYGHMFVKKEKKDNKGAYVAGRGFVK